MAFLRALGYPFWALYHYVFYLPSLNGLVLLYGAVGDLGLAIIILTVIIRILLFPLYQKGVHYQTVMQKLQPSIKEIQKTHKGNYERQSQEMMALYKEHQIHPFSGTLSLLLQLPILIALYQIFFHLFDSGIFNNLYSFVPAPDNLDPTFLGLINLSERNILIVVLAALAQFVQMRLAMPQDGSAGKTAPAPGMQQMVWIAPIMTLVIFWNFPAAISLYWFVTSIFSIGQQLYVNKQLRWKTGSNT